MRKDNARCLAIMYAAWAILLVEKLVFNLELSLELSCVIGILTLLYTIYALVD